MSELRRRLRVLFHRDRFDCELEEEIAAHLAMQAEENEAGGIPPEEARYAARRQFGNTGLLKENSREAWGWGPVESLLQDLHYALRVLRRRPTFAAVAVFSVALGIGANVAIFSLFNALMLRLLPVSRPEQLISVYRTGRLWGNGYASYPLYLELRERKDLFDGVLARGALAKVRMGTAGAEFVWREFVSGNYFQVLGIQPVLGRVFVDDDTRTPGANPYAVLSYECWRARFGGDPSVIGRLVHVGEQPLTVIGVARPGFHGVQTGSRAEVWVPVTMHGPRIMSARFLWVWILARPKPEIGRQQLKAALDALMQQHLWGIYGNKPPSEWRTIAMEQRLEVRPGGIGISQIREQFQKPLELLLALVTLVLLAACANVAGLMLARGAVRSREIALRFSLGASRSRVLRQLVTESILIAGAGSLLGLAFAAWGGRSLLLFVPGAQTLQLSVGPNGPVLAFATAATLVCILIFGVLPAFRSTAVDPAPSLKAGGAAVRGRLLLRKSFVAAQVALSVVLVMTAGLFARSLAALRDVDLGFHNLNVISFDIDFPRLHQNPDSLRVRFLERVNGLPGVLATSCGFPGPYHYGGGWTQSIRAAGSEKTMRESATVQMQSAAPHYFETIGSTLMRGREFQPGDTAQARKVVVVNQAFAREFFNGADPVGRVISFDDEKPRIIVGLVRDMAHESVRSRAVPTIYAPPAQIKDAPSPLLFVRADLPPQTLIPALHRELATLDSSLAILNPRSIRQQIDDSIYVERMLAAVSGFFGMLSLLLAGIGLYGVMAYTVAQRTGEIGTRMALGAGRGNVLWLVLRQGLALIAAGIALGVPLWWASARIAGNLLFGIEPRDPLTLAATVFVLLAAGLLAVIIPARRAAKIDPIEALRYE